MSSFTIRVRSSKDISILDYRMAKERTPETIAYIAHEFAQNAVDACEKAKLTVNGASVIYEVETTDPQHIVDAVESAKRRERAQDYAPVNGRGLGLITIAHNASLQVISNEKSVRIEARISPVAGDSGSDASPLEPCFNMG